MKKKISVRDLKIGMYIDSMDISWFKTPFLKHRFMIKDEEQIEKIRNASLKHVYIDTDKGIDLGQSVPVQPIPGLPPKTPETEKPAETPETMIVRENLSEEQRPSISAPSASSASISPFSDYVRKKEELLSVDRLSILKGSSVDFTIYVKNGMDIKTLAEYDGKSVVITDVMLDRKGELLIEKGDFAKYKSYLRDSLKGGIGDLSTQQVKNIMVKENTKMIVKELLDNPDNSEKMQECRGAVEDIITAIMDSRGIISNLLTINKYDYYTYSHCVNVSVFSVATAIALGVNKDNELFCIGMGSLLHDIGKNTMPPEILNKPEERLTDFEAKMLKEHVIEGYNIVRLYKGIPEETYYPILQHHEKLSGSGYPSQLKGDKMHPFGKIVALTNQYDVLTTSRPTSKAITPFEALSFLRNNGLDYDLNVFREFIKILGKSPQITQSEP